MTQLRFAIPTIFMSTLLVLADARADVVVLEDGETIEGIVRESGDQIIVELDVGTLTLERNMVKEIRKSDTKLQEFRARRQTIRFNDVKGLFKLAEWAVEHRLTTQAHALCEEILKVEENHRQARTMLGYEQHEGRWLTEDERMEATGHVRYGGAWLKAEEAARLDKERKERAETQVREERLTAMERSVAVAQREAEEAKADAQRARQEAESASQNRWFQTGGMGYWPYNPYPRVYPTLYPSSGQRTTISRPTRRSAAPAGTPAPAPHKGSTGRR